MKLFYTLSFRNKVMLIIVSTVIFILSIDFGFSFYSELRSIKKRLLEQKILTAKIVSSYTVPDLTFNDKNAALESLSYLKRDPTVLNAYLYDVNDRHFVSLYDDKHQHIQLDKLDSEAAQSWHYFDNDKVELYILEPIFLETKKIGSLYLHISTSEYITAIKEKLLYYAILLVVLVFIAFITASKLAQIVISPILALADAARSFTKHKTYTLSLTPQYHDEVGQLVNDFNEMLRQIKIREQERDQAEQQLKDNERNLKLILDNMIDAIMTIDVDGSILSTNKAGATLFGVSEQAIRGKPLSQFIPKLFSHVSAPSWQAYLAKLENSATGEVEGQKHNDQNFVMRFSITKLAERVDGKQTFIGSCQDLTHIKQQEEQMRRSQKMDALGKLTGGIAHDYNNMLGVITGYAELLESLLPRDANPKLSKYALQIYQAAERGSKLTQKLLAFSRQTASDAGLLNLNALIDNEQLMLEKTLTARIHLVLDLDLEIWPVYLDASDVVDALLNMSINAMHAMPDGGRLTMQTRNVQFDHLDAAVLDLNPGDYVALTITDTGMGMDKNTKEKIFDPFFSTKGDKGTGLGLSQVYGFVERSNGVIKVYSELGHGTQFILYFPRYFENGQQAVKSDAPETQAISGSGTILVVDDEPALLDLSYDILSHHGYTVICTERAQKALEILASQPIDLLLSDIIMPEMDGYQLAAIVQKEYPNVKIQLASGFADSRHAGMVTDDLSKNLLRKPYNSKVLLEKIRELISA